MIALPHLTAELCARVSRTRDGDPTLVDIGDEFCNPRDSR